MSPTKISANFKIIFQWPTKGFLNRNALFLRFLSLSSTSNINQFRKSYGFRIIRKFENLTAAGFHINRRLKIRELVVGNFQLIVYFIFIYILFSHTYSSPEFKKIRKIEPKATYA